MNKENITKTLENLLGKSRCGKSNEFKQRTAYGTYDILTTKVDKGSTRLNSGVLRNQISVFPDKKIWDESTDEGKRIFYEDQYVFVQVDDDTWDVYQGGGNNGPTRIIEGAKGFKDVLKDQISKINPGLLLKNEELFRNRKAATFLREAMKLTIKEDPNLTHIANLNEYKENTTSLSINNYILGYKKDAIKRSEDVYNDVCWEYNNVDYVLYQEINPATDLEKKFIPIYNKAYHGIFKMQKEDNGYVLYRVTATDSQYSLFLAALRTKPFMLLAGISGTGKSRIVRKLAQATVTKELQKKYEKYTGTNWTEDRWTLHKPANFELIQVKPNWHNSMDVVGYLSNIPSPHYVFTPFIEFISKAWQNPEIPFFLCLDEMNLAPVEEYFAEFLSAIESRSFENRQYLTDPIIKPFNSFNDVYDKGKTISIQDQMINDLLPKVVPSAEKKEQERITSVSEHFKNIGLTLPENLIVIGTVNMDETTYSFSRKVLDRAMSIEMNDVDYNLFLEDKTDDELKTIVEDFEKDGKLNALLVKRHIEAKEIVDTMQDNAQFVIEYLTRINNLLEGTSFKLGYRAANEAIIYVKAAEEFGCSNIQSALDRFTLMKILSRLEGDESKLTVLENEQRLKDANLNADVLKKDGKITLLTCLKEIIKQELSESDDKLQSIKKLNSMIEQLHRDHFVSYWN